MSWRRITEFLDLKQRKLCAVNLIEPPNLQDKPCVFFVDRLLGRKVVPKALRQAGFEILAKSVIASSSVKGTTFISSFWSSFWISCAASTQGTLQEG